MLPSSGSSHTAPPDHLFNKLVDNENRAATGWMGAKTADSKSYPAYVVEFLPAKMKARVILIHAGAGEDAQNAILVDVRVHKQGDLSGSGEAFELTPGQLVDVQFANGVATGLYNQGTIVGTRYTDKDQKAPVSTTWLASGGQGSVHVDHDEKGQLSTVTHKKRGHEYVVRKGDQVEHSMGGGKYKTAGGSSELRTEQVTRKAADSFRLAGEKLGGA